MLKNLIIYRIGGDLPGSAAELDELLQPGRFLSCASQQSASQGWVPPRGQAHGPLVETISGEWILKLMTETKILPGEVIDRRVSELAAEIQENTGRRPGKKQRRELKERVVMELLPRAFSRRSSMWAWIDRAKGRLVVDASSATKASALVHQLVHRIPEANLHPLRVRSSTESCMGMWLLEGEAPHLLTIDREATLESADEMKSVIKYQRAALDSPDVRNHLRSGRVPSRLALTWSGRVSFCLVDDLRIQKVEVANAEFFASPDHIEDVFDADVVLRTGGIKMMLDDLIDALGGEEIPPVEEAASEASQEDAEEDSAYETACTVVREHGRASISLVQRHMRIGYNRAARLLERMEVDGLVSAMGTTGERSVLALDDVGVAAP